MNETGDLAGRGRRFAATAIDFVLVPSLAILLMLVTGALEDAEDYANYPVMRALLLGLVSYLMLNGWLLWQRGQTVGKAIMGIRIVSTRTGARAPLWRLLVLRGPFFATLYGIVLLPFAALPVIDQLLIFTRPRRCGHDWIAGTSVIKRDKARPASPPAG